MSATPTMTRDEVWAAIRAAGYDPRQSSTEEKVYVAIADGEGGDAEAAIAELRAVLPGLDVSWTGDGNGFGDDVTSDVVVSGFPANEEEKEESDEPVPTVDTHYFPSDARRETQRAIGESLRFRGRRVTLGWSPERAAQLERGAIDCGGKAEGHEYMGNGWHVGLVANVAPVETPRRDPAPDDIAAEDV